LAQAAAARAQVGARERILDSAYDLLSRRGVRAVGVDEVISRARSPRRPSTVTSARRTSSCSRSCSSASSSGRRTGSKARRRADTPEGQLLAIFDLFDEWFQKEDFEGCSFINVLLETNDRLHPVGRASAAHLENIRAMLRSLAEEAGLREPEQFAHSFHILMKGSIVAAGEGDRRAARRAQAMARLLIEQHRSTDR
jgi:AcrR family transcriptional regulator